MISDEEWEEIADPANKALFEKLKSEGAFERKPNGSLPPPNVIRLATREAPDKSNFLGTTCLTGINPADWEGAEIPVRKWIVLDYIPDETVTMLSGDGGQGKSLLALQLAVARALERDWIGLKPKAGRTLILSAEDDTDEMHRRLEDIRKFYNATWADLANIRLIDLVGEESILGELIKGQIKPTKMYEALDAYMADFKPGLAVLDVLADMFAGDESDRAQVRQFVKLLKHLARKHHCAILLLSHPSVTGMNTGTGLSGSTDWNNAVRSRLYLQPKPNDSETPNKNLRTFQGMKSNYGERGGKFDLEWNTGVFVRLGEPTEFDKSEADEKVDGVFLSMLTKFRREGRDVSPNPGQTYAPAVFSQHADARGIAKEKLRDAMNRLLDGGKIKIETFGPPSHERKRLVLSNLGDLFGAHV